MKSRKILAVVLAMLMVMACVNLVAYAQAIEEPMDEIIVEVPVEGEEPVSDEEPVADEEPVSDEEPVEDEEPAVERKVVISYTIDTEEVMLGTVVTLHAQLTGFEGVSYTVAWEYADLTDGVAAAWQEAEATGLEYSYTINEQTSHLAWRLRVNVVEESEAAE